MFNQTSLNGRCSERRGLWRLRQSIFGLTGLIRAHLCGQRHEYWRMAQLIFLYGGLMVQVLIRRLAKTRIVFSDLSIAVLIRLEVVTTY